ncbi:MAG: c-type cytochrome [Cereibacter changlensis]
MRTVLKTTAALAGLALLAGLAVVFLGLFNTSARNGHLPLVAPVLHTTFRNSVELRAPPPSEVPELDEARAALGARHYDTACKMCHGAPGQPRSATIRAMVPQPPPIVETVSDWAPNELGWIVREGVKMSGMPGWPSTRDDEVWALVAFLTRVPGMTAENYARLTAPPPVQGPEGVTYCAGCHGAEGIPGNPHIPRLDILSTDYIALSLRSYAEGERQSGIMAQAVSLVPEQALADYVAHFAAFPAGDAPEAPADPGSGLVERGRALALATDASRKVPACSACHGPSREARSVAPRLAGQYAPYLDRQLRLWRDGLRGGGPRANIMREAAARLTDEDIAALAAFYASLGDEPTR